MRGLCSLRKGVKTLSHGNVNTVHLLDSVAKTHRLAIRSSYSAEIVGAPHGLEDAYPTMITLIELKQDALFVEMLKKYGDSGKLPMQVTLTIDAESVYKSLTSLDLKTSAEKTLLGHVMWIRDQLEKGTITQIQWCDTRDMVADGHTKGSVDRKALLDLMNGIQCYQHAVKTYKPHRSSDKVENDVEHISIIDNSNFEEFQ